MVFKELKVRQNEYEYLFIQIMITSKTGAQLFRHFFSKTNYEKKRILSEEIFSNPNKA